MTSKERALRLAEFELSGGVQKLKAALDVARWDSKYAGNYNPELREKEYTESRRITLEKLLRENVVVLHGLCLGVSVGAYDDLKHEHLVVFLVDYYVTVKLSCSMLEMAQMVPNDQ